MAQLTNTGENAVRGAVLGTASLTSGTRYLRLWTADPLEDLSGGPEVSGGSYTGKAVSWTLSATAGEASNSAAVEFPNMPACTVTHATLATAASGGSHYLYGALTTPKTVGAGDTLRFAIGDVLAIFT